MPVFFFTKPTPRYSWWNATPVVWELEAVFPTLDAALDAEERVRERKYAIQIRSSEDFPGIDPASYMAAEAAYHTFAKANPRAPIHELSHYINEACSRFWDLQVALHPLVNP